VIPPRHTILIKSAVPEKIMVAPSQPTYFICAAAGGAPTLFFIHYYLLFL